jgi:hypothetical protein
VGLDRLSVALVVVAAMLLSGCDTDKGGRPARLLYGEAVQELAPVRNSIVTIGRVVDATALGRRFASCRPDGVRSDSSVVERIGVFAESLTFAADDGNTVYSCDGGIDAARERKAPWCGGSAGRLVSGQLLDPRLDILCRDRSGKALAYAWVEPARVAHWIGVDQGSYVELYEVLGRLPVRIASTRGVELGRARATFRITQYDERGTALLTGKLEARVAG